MEYDRRVELCFKIFLVNFGKGRKGEIVMFVCHLDVIRSDKNEGKIGRKTAITLYGKS